jgi:hypothetical protein
VWGYFIGISAAGLWDYINLFVTTFLRSGLQWLYAWISTGHLERMDQVIAVPAWLANFLVVAGSVWAYTRLPEKRRSDLGRFGLTSVLTTGFFAASVAICQPRYLPLFRSIFHPHRPWYSGRRVICLYSRFHRFGPASESQTVQQAAPLSQDQFRHVQRDGKGQEARPQFQRGSDATPARIENRV